MAGTENSNQNTNQEKISKNGPQLLEAAVRAHQTGDIKNAEMLYLAAINSGFNHEIAYSNLGVIYKNTGRREKAVEVYEHAIAINPSFASAYTNLGNLYKDLGNLNQALAFTLKSLELKPENPDSLYNLGCIYKDLGNLDQALTSTIKSLELKPDNHVAHMNLGGIYKDLGYLDKALASTLQSLELKPDNFAAHRNLGSIYQDLGNLDQALASTLKSLDLEPGDPDTYMNLGRIYKDLSNVYQKYIDDSIKAFKESLRINPNNANTKLGLNSARKELITSQEVMTINNKTRSKAFYDAITHAMKGGEDVIEIGKSTGLYSMIAADKGARSVTKLVESKTIKSAAKAVIDKNNYDEKVTVVLFQTGEDKDEKNITPKADLVVTDLLSADLTDSTKISKLSNLSQTFLKENGKIIPESIEMKAALLGKSPEVNDLLKVDFVNGYDLSEFNEIMKKNHSYKLYERPNIISEPITISKIDFTGNREMQRLEDHAFIESTVSETCIGVVTWSKLNLYSEICYEENPSTDNQRNYLSIYLFERPFEIKCRQTAKIKYLIKSEIGAWFEFIELLDNKGRAKG